MNTDTPASWISNTYQAHYEGGLPAKICQCFSEHGTVVNSKLLLAWGIMPLFIKEMRTAPVDRGGALCGSERTHRTRTKSTHKASKFINFPQSPRSHPAYIMAAALVSTYFDFDEPMNKVRKLIFARICRSRLWSSTVGWKGNLMRTWLNNVP